MTSNSWEFSGKVIQNLFLFYSQEPTKNSCHVSAFRDKSLNAGSILDGEQRWTFTGKRKKITVRFWSFSAADPSPGFV